MLHDFENKKVTVMGIGLHGGAVDLILYLAKKGAKITATDLKTKEQLEKSLEKLKEVPDLKLVLGEHRAEDFTEADLVVKNPTVPWDNHYIELALQAGVPVEMDSSLFFRLCQSENIIGVTGSKGKTTTATLICRLLEKAGKNPVAVGIGQEPVMSKLNQIKKATPVVFELSSWRLSALERAKVSPKVAVITNIYPDHLNYYSSMEDYIEDKKAIFSHQKPSDFLVVNANQEIAQEFANSAKGKGEVFYAAKQKVDLEKAVYLEKGKLKANWQGEENEIMAISEIALQGEHNLSNLMLAAAAALIMGVKPVDIREVLSQPLAIAHRNEKVAEIEGVEFYNDTSATVPEAACASISGFSKSINLIAGGANKNLDLKPLAEKIAIEDKVRRVFLLAGEATAELESLIEKLGGKEKVKGIYYSMEEAVTAASDQARRGEIVLLSPGCASFGLFENEFDRGEKFYQAVGKLENKNDNGKPKP